jgi:uncharacterized protein
MPVTDLLFVAGVIFAATIIRALFGFASALIVVPIFAMRFGIATASPTFAIVSVVISFAMLSRRGITVDKASLAGLIGSALLGMVPGVLLLRTIPNRWLSLGLAGFILIAVALMLLRRRKERLEATLATPAEPAGAVRPARHLSAWWAIPYGFIAGAIMGAYVAGGPPIALYGTRRGWPPEQFRDNLQVFFLVSSPILIVQYALVGALSRDILLMAAVASPAAVAAVFVGRSIARRIPQERFFGVVFLLLIGIATSLIARNIG